MENVLSSIFFYLLIFYLLSKRACETSVVNI